MKTIIRENTWLLRTEAAFGWGNGYVLIPKGHPLHGKGRSEINVNVHNGISMACLADELEWKELKTEDKECWVIGFHTAHLGDNMNSWPKSAVEAETEKLRKQVENIKS